MANNLPAVISANDLKLALEDRGFNVDYEIEKLCKSLSRTLKSEKKFTTGKNAAGRARAMDVRIKHQIAYLRVLIDVRDKSASADDANLQDVDTEELRALMREYGVTLEKTTLRVDPQKGESDERAGEVIDVSDQLSDQRREAGGGDGEVPLRGGQDHGGE